MDFLYLLRVLLKRKWLILGVGFVAAAIAYGLTTNQPKKYRSFMQFSTGFTVNDEVKVNTENVDIYTADVKFNNVVVTVLSPTVMSLLSYNLILHDLESGSPFRRPDLKGGGGAFYQSIEPRTAMATFQDKLDSMSVLTSFKPDELRLLEYLSLYHYDYNDLAQNIAIYRVQRTDYMEIDAVTENPELSAFIVNNIFPEFLRYSKGIRSTTSAESIDTLKSLMDKKKQELDARNQQLRSAGVVDVGDENNSKLEIVMNLDNTLTQEQTQQTRRRYDLDKVNQQLNNLPPATNSTKPASHTATNDELVILRRSMDDAFKAWVNSGSSDPKLQQKYENLKTQYQSKFAELTPTTDAATTATQDDTRQKLEEKKSDLEVDIRAGNENIGSLQSKIASTKASLVKDASKDADVETLIKEAEMANREYLAAKQRYTDAVDNTTSKVITFRPVIAGQPAIAPEPSKRVLIVGMAGASAIVITMLVLVLLTYLDTSIKTPLIFARTVGLPLISMVNFMSIRQRRLGDLITTRETIPDPLANKRHNQFRESLRKLRYEIERSGKKIFLFASTKKGEGKTTLIQAVSYSLSMSKKKVLIIDTNFCNPDLTAQLEADPILEQIHPSSGRPDTNLLLDQVRQAAKKVADGIYVIGSLGGDYTPSEILPRENLLQHLQTLTAEYDFIFLEGPPLNDFSDSKELVRYVDGVIAVFSAQHIIKQIDRQSMSFFNELNGKFCGAVLNMVDLEDVNVT
jgi:succinoglycan biosynthesis transport protein ExoP